MKTSEFIYLYKNKEYPVHVTCKRQRNIYYRYKEDGFHVSAPYLVGKKTIIQGLDKFADKIIAQYEKSHSNFSFEEDYVWLLGEQISLSSQNIKNMQDLSSYLQKNATFFITELVRKYERIMGVSESYKVKVRDTERQYGSNSKRTHTLSFQTGLIHYSPEIIETVVVHELAHDIERNHSKNFYNIVYSFSPEYKEIQKKLKKGIHK